MWTCYCIYVPKLIIITSLLPWSQQHIHVWDVRHPCMQTRVGLLPPSSTRQITSNQSLVTLPILELIHLITLSQLLIHWNLRPVLVVRWSSWCQPATLRAGNLFGGSWNSASIPLEKQLYNGERKHKDNRWMGTMWWDCETLFSHHSFNYESEDWRMHQDATKD